MMFKKLIKNRNSTNSMIVFLSSSSFISNFLNIISGIIILKWLLPSEIGFFSSFTIIVGYITLVHIGVPVALMHFVNAIEDALGKKGKIKLEPIQAGDVPRTYADVQSLFDYINFKPSTNINDGVKAFVDKYLEIYSNSDA